MSFGLSSTILLILGQLKTIYAIGFGLAAMIISTYLVTRHINLKEKVKLSKDRNIWNVLVLFGISGWGIFNEFFVAKHVITDRDPGVYANAGIWLIHHNSMNESIPSLFSNISGVFSNSPGFSSHIASGQAYLYPQGMHLLPIFLGLSGRIFGLNSIFHVNILFGMAALLTIYAVSRLLVRPLWAAVITGALAGTMPFIYFSRDTYTEPLAATFIFASLLLLYFALKYKKKMLWFFTGLLVGAVTMTRIDGYLVIASYAAFLIVNLLLINSNERKNTIKQSLALALGAFASSAVGWLDLYLLSNPYYQASKTQVMEEVYLIVFILLLGSVFVFVAWRKDTIRRLGKYTKNWRVAATQLTAVLLIVFMASRPLWLRGHGSNGERNYAELSIEWLSWYLGPLLAIIAAIGIAITASRLFKSYKPFLSAVSIVFAVTALVYVINPNISPDQIWASRRYVPLILPGVALFGAIAIEAIVDHFYSVVRWPRVYLIIVIIVILVAPLITSRPLLLEHDTSLLSPVKNICNNLPKNSVILWTGRAGTFLTQPTRTICGIQAFGYGQFYAEESPPQSTLAAISKQASSAGKVALIGIFGTNSYLLKNGQNSLTTIGSYDYTKLTDPVENAPQGLDTTIDVIQMGVIQSNGIIKPI
jgi:hypothetical protein